MSKLNGVTLTWLGHATWLITSPEGKRILVDPWLDGNPACPDEYKGDGVGNVDVIICTHGHFDHIGDLVSAATRTGAPVVGIYDLTSWAGEQEGMDAGKMMGGNKGGTIPVNGLKVTLVNALHSASFNGRDMGDPCGFILEFENGYKIYNAGDTDVFGDMALIAELYEPDLVMLPIGDWFTMGPKQAAKAVELLGAKLVVPQHYATFPILTGRPAALQALVGDDVEVFDINPGDTIR
jgi:L-ascorbate metabolism protein UlaG (beta-lactamase superfamily)